jgi:hypothetical protein
MLCMVGLRPALPLPLKIFSLSIRATGSRPLICPAFFISSRARRSLSRAAGGGGPRHSPPLVEPPDFVEADSSVSTRPPTDDNLEISGVSRPI